MLTKYNTLSARFILKYTALIIATAFATVTVSTTAQAAETLFCNFPKSNYQVRLEGNKDTLAKSKKFKIVDQTRRPQLVISPHAYGNSKFKGKVTDKKINITLPYWVWAFRWSGPSTAAYGQVRIASKGKENGKVRLDFEIATPPDAYALNLPFRSDKGTCIIEED